MRKRLELSIAICYNRQMTPNHRNIGALGGRKTQNRAITGNRKISNQKIFGRNLVETQRHKSW